MRRTNGKIFARHIERWITVAGLVFGICISSSDVFGQVVSASISQILQDGDEAIIYMGLYDGQDKLLQGDYESEDYIVSVDEEKLDSVSVSDRYNAEAEGVTWLLCLDLSEAIDRQQLQQIKAAVGEMIEDMSPQDAAGIIAFGAQAQYQEPLSDNLDSVKTAVRELEPMAGKPVLFEALKLSLDTVRKNGDDFPRRTAIVVFTSGEDNSGQLYSEGEIQKTSNRTHTPIFIVGLDGDDLSAVDRIARYSGGTVLYDPAVSLQDRARQVMQIIRDQTTLKVKVPEKIIGNGNYRWKVSVINTDGDEVQSPSYLFAVNSGSAAEEKGQPENEDVKDTAGTDASHVIILDPDTAVGLSGTTAIDESNKWRLIVFAELAAVAMVAAMIILLGIKRKKTSPEKTSVNQERTDLYNVPEQIDKFPHQNGIEVSLIITFQGRTEKRKITVDDFIVLGRGKDCDVDVTFSSDDETARQTSRKHAVILLRSGKLYVQDAGAVNGLRLNGEAVKNQAQLTDGDLLKLGAATVECRFQRGDNVS